MKKKFVSWVSLIVAIAFLAGCSTLSVEIPKGMYVSTGDYHEDVRTVGIIQESVTVFAPLFIYNMNTARTRLYKGLINKAERMGAEGITNVEVYWKLSPFSVFTLLLLSPIITFYAEGVVIDK